MTDQYQQLVETALTTVDEVFPWDLEEEIEQDLNLIVLDIREQDEFDMISCRTHLVL